MPDLVTSDALLPDARRIRDDVALGLTRLGIRGEVVLTGGSSVPGALTKGDVDLHLRVAPDDFRAVIDTLRGRFAVASADAWAPTLAVFAVPADLPTGLAVTPRGSEHDERFTRAWAALRGDAALLAAYNEVKSAYADGPDYEQHKGEFFTALDEDGSRSGAR